MALLELTVMSDQKLKVKLTDEHLKEAVKDYLEDRLGHTIGEVTWILPSTQDIDMGASEIEAEAEIIK
jgi:hypothetical protein